MKKYLLLLIAVVLFGCGKVSNEEKASFMKKINLYDDLRKTYEIDKGSLTDYKFILSKQIKLIDDINNLKTYTNWSVSDTMKASLIKMVQMDTMFCNINLKNVNEDANFKNLMIEAADLIRGIENNVNVKKIAIIQSEELTKINIEK